MPSAYGEAATWPLPSLFGARSTILLSIPGLQQYEPSTEQRKVGEAYALIGYAEVFLAEDYCAGATLDRVRPGGGWEWGMPLTTDSLFAVAEAHFDSAIAHANGDTTVLAFANAGLARARLGRGHYADAKAAAANVPTAFVYNIVGSTDDYYSTNFYQSNAGYCSYINTGDSEGTNGLNFVSANDPRLVIDSTMPTCDLLGEYDGAKPWYYPIKFGTPPSNIPLATGIEARLVEVEAAFQAHDPSWLDKLNALRTTCTDASTCPSPPSGSGGVAGLAPLDDPGTDAARIDLIFRERAFWLFGTGTRLGDLRRLIRQYGRAGNTVFPTGPYGNGQISDFPAYGDDVSLTLPTGAGSYKISNPNYKGCLTPTTAG